MKKGFKCDHCGRVYKRLALLLDHIRDIDPLGAGDPVDGYMWHSIYQKVIEGFRYRRLPGNKKPIPGVIS